MDLGTLQARAVAIKELYDRHNATAGRTAWTSGDVALGFVGDVGDLAKLVHDDTMQCFYFQKDIFLDQYISQEHLRRARYKIRLHHVFRDHKRAMVHNRLCNH